MAEAVQKVEARAEAASQKAAVLLEKANAVAMCTPTVAAAQAEQVPASLEAGVASS